MPSFDQVLAPVTVGYSSPLSESLHPNTNWFNYMFQQLQDQIESLGMTQIVKNLPGEDTLVFAKNRRFVIDDVTYFYPIALYLGKLSDGGKLWACPDGNVIRERSHPNDTSRLWTLADRDMQRHIRRWVINDEGEATLRDGLPAPFDQYPVLWNGLTSPMSPRVHALVRFYINLHALGTDITKHRLEFPDLDALVDALKLLAPADIVKEMIEAADVGAVDGTNGEKLESVAPAEASSPALVSLEPVGISGTAEQQNDETVEGPSPDPSSELLDAPLVHDLHQRAQIVSKKSPVGTPFSPSGVVSGPDKEEEDGVLALLSTAPLRAPTVPNMIPSNFTFLEGVGWVDSTKSEAHNTTQLEAGESRPSRPRMSANHTIQLDEQEKSEIPHEQEVADLGVTFATKKLLNLRVGAKLISLLPPLSAVKISRQRDGKYVGLRLLIGTPNGRKLYVQFKPTKNRAVAPSMCMMIGRPSEDSNDSGNDDQHVEKATSTEVGRLLDQPTKFFDEPFSNAYNIGELQAAAKYYFVLAAADNLYGFSDRLFPLNDTFENSLRRFCERVKDELTGEDSAMFSEDEGPSRPPLGGLSLVLGEEVPFPRRRRANKQSNQPKPTGSADGVEAEDESDGLFVSERPNSPQQARPTRSGPFVISSDSSASDIERDPLAIHIRPKKPRVPRKSPSPRADKSEKPVNPLTKRYLELVARNTELKGLKQVKGARITKIQSEAINYEVKAQKLMAEVQAKMAEATELMDKARMARESIKQEQVEESGIDIKLLANRQKASGFRFADDEMVDSEASEAADGAAQAMEVDSGMGKGKAAEDPSVSIRESDCGLTSWLQKKDEPIAPSCH